METIPQALEEEIKAMDTDQPLQAGDLVKKYYKKQIHLSYVLFGVGILIIFLNLYLGVFVIFLGIFMWWLVHASIEGKINRELVTRIAALLHYEYKDSDDPSTLSGKVFQIGEQKSMTNVMGGMCDSFPLRLFTYSFTVKEHIMENGKYRDRIHPFTYSFFEIEFSSDLPSMAVVSETIDRKYLLPAIALEEEAKLEGNFNDSFYTYVEKDRQMEIRQILTPDIMAQLMDTMPTYSFFTSGKKLYVCMNTLGSKDDYVGANEKVKYLVSKWSPQLTRM